MPFSSQRWTQTPVRTTPFASVGVTGCRLVWTATQAHLHVKEELDVGIGHNGRPPGLRARGRGRCARHGRQDELLDAVKGAERGLRLQPPRSAGQLCLHTVRRLIKTHHD